MEGMRRVYGRKIDVSTDRPHSCRFIHSCILSYTFHPHKRNPSWLMKRSERNCDRKSLWNFLVRQHVCCLTTQGIIIIIVIWNHGRPNGNVTHIEPWRTRDMAWELLMRRQVKWEGSEAISSPLSQGHRYERKHRRNALIDMKRFKKRKNISSHYLLPRFQV